MLNKVVEQVTQRIIERSKPTREAYLARMREHYGKRVQRASLACTNLAHAVAAEEKTTKLSLKAIENPNIGIVTAYNDMLSAHQPYYRYPELIKTVALQNGATAQVAGGVPAMCDGVTQGQIGMELSLLSREVIAMSTAVSLSHNVFDGVVCLGICDKIVPGLLIGALSYGYLPTIFIPSGPMPSGISNKEKTETRKLYAEGKVGSEALLESELKSYHAPGTCTFYGTANTNQMMMEVFGLHIPGAAFILPNTPLRHAITEEAVKQIVKNTAQRENFTPLCEIVSEKSIVNAIVGLLASGGSTNHTLHIPAIAKAAGIIVNWDDFAELSSVVPLLAKVYPNGDSDVNQFHAAGGMAYIIEQLLAGGFVHDDVKTVLGTGLSAHAKFAALENDKLVWQEPFNHDSSILSSNTEPFSHEGGVRLLEGNLGRSVTKISAIAEEHRYVKAPAGVFHSQDDVLAAYKRGDLNKDVVVVLKYQGPRANGMPELHKLVPALLSLQGQGFAVALVTDGRMSGATGKVPNAIHLTPEAVMPNSQFAKILDGDIIELDLNTGKLQLQVSAAELAARVVVTPDLSANQVGLGRELFGHLRSNLSESELGATLF